MDYRVAVVGATGAVGREILKTLDERNFPADEVIALASGRSAGQEVSFGERDGWPGSVVSASSENDWRTSKVVPSGRRYS